MTRDALKQVHDESPDLLTGTCECGAAAERPRATGLGADMLNSFSLRCDDCDYRMEEKLEAEEQAERLRRRQAEIERRLQGSGLPLELRKVLLGTLDRTGCGAAIDAASVWADDGGGLVFTGPFGVGKTTIAAGAFRIRLDGHRGRWASTPLVMARLGSGFGTPQREWALETLTATSALVLDDLDKTRPTEYGAEQIFLTVDGAVSNGRALLTTTNLSLSQLAAKWPAPFGEAIVSRLAGYCNVVELTGADRRLKAAA